MYKVAVIGISVKGNRLAKFGEILSEKQLNGNAKELVKKGFITKANKEEIDAYKKTDSKEEKPVSRMNTAELVAKAKEVGVEFTEGDTTNALKAARVTKKVEASK